MFPQRDYINGTLTTENIFRKVSSYEIFRYYVGKFIPNKVFNSPLRKDKKPSFAIRKFNEGWFFKDFATGDSGNCFKFVQKKYSCDFKGSLNRINLDLNLGLDNSVTLPGEYVQKDFRPDFVKKRTIIQVKSRQWQIVDKNYWESFGISKEILNLYEVKPLTHYWINEHYFIAKELCYGYRFGSALYKIYFPLRTSDKWYSNVTSEIIQGYNQLEYKKDQLIITKSLKDVMVLHSVGIEAIAPQAESVLLNQSQINYFRKKYRKIYCLYDWDRAGRHLAWLCRNNYGIEPIKFSDSNNSWVMKQGYMGCKDISDFVKVHGKEEFLKRLNSF